MNRNIRQSCSRLENFNHNKRLGRLPNLFLFYEELAADAPTLRSKELTRHLVFSDFLY